MGLDWTVPERPRLRDLVDLNLEGTINTLRSSAQPSFPSEMLSILASFCWLRIRGCATKCHCLRPPRIRPSRKWNRLSAKQTALRNLGSFCQKLKFGCIFILHQFQVLQVWAVRIAGNAGMRLIAMKVSMARLRRDNARRS